MKEVGKIKLNNTRTRQIINAVDTIIDGIPGFDEEEKNKLKQSVQHYRSAMFKLRQHENFDNSDIDEFQKEFDDFFQSWVSLTRASGCTNYIHLLSLGHMTFYLTKYRNMYSYSNQGWEALNGYVFDDFYC